MYNSKGSVRHKTGTIRTNLRQGHFWNNSHFYSTRLLIWSQNSLLFHTTFHFVDCEKRFLIVVISDWIPLLPCCVTLFLFHLMSSYEKHWHCAHENDGKAQYGGRDAVGYGRAIPKPTWPKKAKVSDLPCCNGMQWFQCIFCAIMLQKQSSFKWNKLKWILLKRLSTLGRSQFCHQLRRRRRSVHFARRQWKWKTLVRNRWRRCLW